MVWSERQCLLSNESNIMLPSFLFYPDNGWRIYFDNVSYNEIGGVLYSYTWRWREGIVLFIQNSKEVRVVGNLSICIEIQAFFNKYEIHRAEKPSSLEMGFNMEQSKSQYCIWKAEFEMYELRSTSEKEASTWTQMFCRECHRVDNVRRNTRIQIRNSISRFKWILRKNH